MKKQLDKNYNPKEFEQRVYAYWTDERLFSASPNPNKTPFTIVIPPPNITGRLHMGHALDSTLQDVLIRLKRMQGYEALWVPGTDHASIATEAKIVEALTAEGTSKEALGRDEFLVRAWAWKEQYGGEILNQLKKMGCSCDWEKERFTLDEGCSKAVVEVFVRLYEQGLIYQGERLINWCPHCLTSISDAEVLHSEKEGFFWHLRYPLSDGSGYVSLATTRPETLLGDAAVAVHPEDSRYRHLVGKSVTLPLCGREIPIIADSYVDMAFGTGVVKITPAHDVNDFEVGLRHNLPMRTILTEDAHMTLDCFAYAGMERYAARKAIVADLGAAGLLEQAKPHTHNVGQCYRCDTVVEPRLSTQWFVKMETLAKDAIDVVKQDQIRFVPKRFDKIYFHWMENIKDWCISRQLWWGHRIPAYYCDDCALVTVAKQKPTQCVHCGGVTLRQDEDTLDTWFSSALWPFSTLGWPEKTKELEYFYPTNVIAPGYDIIFFWVARMIFSGLAHTGKPPFDTVLIHGLVRDAQGRKMSKSLGNGIDPLEVIEQYGADALRFMLASGNAPGSDLRYSEEKVLAARNFANKLWNATRFIEMNLPLDTEEIPLPPTLTLEDKWILHHCNTVVAETTENFEKFEFGIALSKIYDFIWNYFCDWTIELAKERLQADAQTALEASGVLLYVMRTALQLLHPFMPFVTEEIWQSLRGTRGSIMVSTFPTYQDSHCFAKEAAEFEKVIEAIRAIRVARAEKNIKPSKRSVVYIESEDFALFEDCAPFFVKLAFASSVQCSPTNGVSDAMQLVTSDARIFLSMAELIDKDEQRKRLQKELLTAEKEVQLLQQKLQNESFVQKAPPAVVEKEQQKLSLAKEKCAKIQQSLQENI